MSQKLPIGDVLNEAVQFSLHRWGSILRFAWVPTLVSLLLFGLVMGLVFDWSTLNAADETTKIDNLQEVFRVPVPFAVSLLSAAYLAMIFLYCGVLASLFRLVALGEERTGFFQLRMDGPTLRVFFAYLIIMIINFLIWTAAFAVAIGTDVQSWTDTFKALGELFWLAGTAEAGNEAELETAILALTPSLGAFGKAFLFALIPIFYVNMKLVPFPAGSAAENRLLLFGSFGMTFGHFWSIVGISIMSILFLIMISIVFQLATAVFQGIALVLAAQGAGFAAIGGVLVLILVMVSFVFQLFIFGFQTALQAIIYRRLRTGE